MKKLLKFLGALAGLLVLLVIALVAFVMLTLKPNLPGSEFALQPLPADGARNVLVFGATGKLGTEIVRDLREHGDQVTAFEAGSFDASIATIAGLAEPDLDRLGIINVADAAVANRVQRVILISTVGAGDSRDAAPLISRLALSKILPQKSAAEEHFRASGLSYTIIRPGGLPPGVVPTERGILSDDPATMGFIKRPDLARLVVGVLYDDRTIGKTLAAVDPGLERPWSGGDP